MEAEEIIRQLKALANPEAVSGLARFGSNPRNPLGIAVPQLRKMAKDIGKDHFLARQLWDCGIHEARILAAFIDQPQFVTGQQMEEWLEDFDSWDICDQVCGNLFDQTTLAYAKATEWSHRAGEFQKRAGFALMAALAVHDKLKDDREFLQFLEIIKKEAPDERNFVKKAVNWALRQIGKRNIALNRAALATAQDIYDSGLKGAKWIATDARRELRSDQVQKRLSAKREQT